MRNPANKKVARPGGNERPCDVLTTRFTATVYVNISIRIFSFLSFFPLFFFLPFVVFVEEGDANSFLSRRLLKNHFDFEMLVKGNLERECYEEVCNYEEAREVFENIPQTVE